MYQSLLLAFICISSETKNLHHCRFCWLIKKRELPNFEYVVNQSAFFSFWLRPFLKEIMTFVFEQEKDVDHPPLALIGSLLSLLQLGKSCGQTLLSSVQLLFNQLDASVQGSYITLSLGESNTTKIRSSLLVKRW